MEKFLKTVDRISELSGKGVSFLVIPLVAVILYEIIARYVFQSPTIWVHETAQMIYGAYVILLGAYVLRRRRRRGANGDASNAGPAGSTSWVHPPRFSCHRQIN